MKDARGDTDLSVKLPRELLDGQWGDVHDGGYQAQGGYDFGSDEVSEPDRDIKAITATLADAEQGDILRLTIGTAEAAAETTLYVLGHERNVAGFDHRLNSIMRPRSDGWTRLYLTTLGDDHFDPWEVVSMPYHLEEATGDMRDFVGHGWLIDAEFSDGDVDRVGDGR